MRKVQVKSSTVQQDLNALKVLAHRKNAMQELIVQAASHPAPNALQVTIAFQVLLRLYNVQLVVTAKFKLKYVSCVPRVINVLMVQLCQQFVKPVVILVLVNQTVTPVLQAIFV